MGLFDFFLSEEKKIQKQQRRVVNRDLQTEDREAAAQWLVDQGSGKALVALLGRFDMNLENQLKDKAEKELVYGLLAQKGEELIKPLGVHLRRCRQFALPIRLLGEIQGERAATEKVIELLALEREKDDFKPEKKTHLLVWLAEREHPQIVEAVTPFLSDFDEGVRYAAVEALIAQGTEAAREPLLAVLANAEEDSNRLRVRIADIFAQRRWSVGDAEISALLPDRFMLRGDRVVQS